MDYSENADILGQPTLPIAQPEAQGSKFFSTTGLFYLAALVVCAFIGMRIRREILAYQEKAYKLQAFFFFFPLTFWS